MTDLLTSCYSWFLHNTTIRTERASPPEKTDRTETADFERRGMPPVLTHFIYLYRTWYWWHIFHIIFELNYHEAHNTLPSTIMPPRPRKQTSCLRTSRTIPWIRKAIFMENKRLAYAGSDSNIDRSLWPATRLYARLGRVGGKMTPILYLNPSFPMRFSKLEKSQYVHKQTGRSGWAMAD